MLAIGQVRLLVNGLNVLPLLVSAVLALFLSLDVINQGKQFFFK